MDATTLGATRLRRLIAYMEHRKMLQDDGTPSPKALYDATMPVRQAKGLTPRRISYLNDLLKGNKSFGDKVARALEDELPDIDPYYLDGVEPAETEWAEVKRIHQRLSAGRGHAVYYDAKESWLAFQPSFLRKVGVSIQNAAIFDISGRSMEPELHDGAVALITMSNRHDTIIDGKHYAFICGDDCLVKTLYKMAGGTIKAVSQNPDKDEFPDFIIHPGKERFEMLGRVLWEGRVI